MKEKSKLIVLFLLFLGFTPCITQTINEYAVNQVSYHTQPRGCSVYDHGAYKQAFSVPPSDPDCTLNGYYFYCWHPGSYSITIRYATDFTSCLNSFTPLQFSFAGSLVSVRFRYKAENGGSLSLKLSTDDSNYYTVTKFYDEPMESPIEVTIPFGEFSSVGSPTISNIGSITADLSYYYGGGEFDELTFLYTGDFSSSPAPPPPPPPSPPSNYHFSGAQVVVPSESVFLNNTLGSTDEEVLYCELVNASAFLWYKIEAAPVDRVIDIDTCYVGFDTVIGIFNGTSIDNLTVLACNDDGEFNVGNYCYPSASAISNFILYRDIDFYVVVGGYKLDGVPATGGGSINFNLQSVADIPLNFGTFSSVISTVNDKIDDLSSAVTSAVQSSTNSLTTSIQTSGNDVQTAISTATQTIINDIGQTETLINSLYAALNSSNLATVGNGESLTALSNSVTALSGVVNGIVASVSALQTLVTANADISNTNFTTVQSKIDTLQTDTSSILSQSSTTIANLVAAQNSIDAVSNSLVNTGNSLNSAISSVSLQVGGVSDSIATVSSQITQGNSAIATQIGGVSTKATNIQTTADSSLNILNGLQNNVKSDTAQTLFKQDILYYLTDSTINAPINYRIPNAYGGKMDDIATYVTSTYNSLKASALAIGAKGSTACNSNSFCNFFFNTAEPTYLSSYAKYVSNLNIAKYSVAWTNLSKAYLSLYPAT